MNIKMYKIYKKVSNFTKNIKKDPKDVKLAKKVTKY